MIEDVDREVDARLLYTLRFSVRWSEFPDWEEHGLAWLELNIGQHVPWRWYMDLRLGQHELWIGWAPQPPQCD